MAAALKDKGNAAFSAGDYEGAIKYFTEAIAIDAQNHVLYSNRSAAEAKLENYKEALDDAKKCVELKPDWAKGYSRLGAAYHGLGEYPRAIEAYEQGLKVDPNSEQLKEALQEAKDAQEDEKAPKSPFASPTVLAKLAADPRTREILKNPDSLRKLQHLQRDPSAMMMYLRDPIMAPVFEVAFGFSMASAADFAAEETSAPNGTEAETSKGSTGGAATESSAPSRSQAPPAPPPAEQSVPEEMDVDDEEKLARQRKAQALKEKEAGNAAYKKKDFAAAIAHYDKALELDDTDISFLTNRAAVYYEQGEYDKVIEDCERAVERGRELRADYKLVARAMTRKGNALVQLDRLEDAVDVYNKALTEHRTADTLQKLNETQKKLKERREKDYIDLDKAAEEKDLGNTAFKEQRYPEAVKHYSESLRRGPSNVNPEAYKVYSNLAACYTKLTAFNEGLAAAEKCIELQPDFVKGYSRKGAIQFFMKEYEKALDTYEKGLTHDPENEELKEGRMRCFQAINRITMGQASEEELKERQAKAMADPEIQALLMDPVMRNVLNDFQSDPKAAQHHLRNSSIMAKVSKLVAAGIIQVK